MILPAIAALFATLALNDVLVGAAPSFSIGNIRFGSDRVFDNEYENVNSKIYNIITRVGSSKGVCVKHVTATGNGVGDVFDLPCSPDGIITFTSDKFMIYGSPKQNSFSLFSNSPSVMTVFQDNKCTERKYKTVTRKTFSEISDLSDEECTKLRNKIDCIIEEEIKYLDVLDKHDDDNTPQNPQNLYNPAKSSFKSAAETTNSVNQQNKPTETQPSSGYASSSSGTPSENTKQDSPLEPYNQYHEALNPDDNNLKPVAWSHQDTPHNGITVTEQLSTHNTNVAAPEAVTVTEQESTHNTNVPAPDAVTVTEQDSTHNTNVHVPVAVTVTEQESTHNTNEPDPVAVTVTEQVSTTNTNAPVPEAVTDTEQESTHNTNVPDPVAVTVTDQDSNINNQGAVDEVSSTTGDQTSNHGSLDSYLDRLAAKYAKLKTQVANHVHKPSGDGWDFSALNNYLHSSHT